MNKQQLQNLDLENMTPEKIKAMGGHEMSPHDFKDVEDAYNDLINTQDELQKLSKDAIQESIKGLEDLVNGLKDESSATIEYFDKNGTDNISEVDHFKLQEALQIDANLRELENHVNLILFINTLKVEESISTNFGLIHKQIDKYAHFCRSNGSNAEALTSIVNKLEVLPEELRKAYKAEIKALYFVLRYFNTNKSKLLNRVLYIRLTIQVLITSILSGRKLAFIDMIDQASK